MSTRRFKPYPAYKDCAVEWLGDIPAHWEMKPFTKFVVEKSDYRGKTPEKVPSGVFLVTARNVRMGLIDYECSQEFVSQEEYDQVMRRGLPKRGDILFTTEAPLGNVALVDREDVALAQRIIRFRMNAKYFDSRFTLFAMMSSYFQAQLLRLSTGSTAEGLKASKLPMLHLVAPPLDEQRAIHAFLDRETARIDGLVAKKERLIGLLQEKRTALITRAVTKGLDPNVPMKDSGIEWLGAIPEHWGIERIKWVAHMESGHTPDKKVESYWQSGNIPWVSLADTGQLREVDYIANTAVMTTSDGIAHSSAHVLPAETVVFSRDATIGLCAITCTGMAVSQHFIGWVCSPRLQPEYLLFVLRSMTRELERLTMGATVRTIGMPDVRSLVTPVPPVVEQKEIVRHVHRHRAQVDSLVAKIHEAIDRLKELRTALISAAVTGKIDVREEVA